MKPVQWITVLAFAGVSSMAAEGPQLVIPPSKPVDVPVQNDQSAGHSPQKEDKGPPITRLIENTFRNWTFEELPIPVQKTVQSQAAGHRISDIDREDRAGQTVWEVEFDGGPNGQDREIHIDNDGGLVEGDGTPVLSEPFKVQGLTAIPKDQIRAAEASPIVREKWAGLPPGVQQAAQRFGGQPSVRDIDKEKREGMIVWELEFERASQNIELHFLADGRILEHLDSANRAEAKGSAPSGQRGRGTQGAHR